MGEDDDAEDEDDDDEEEEEDEEDDADLVRKRYQLGGFRPVPSAAPTATTALGALVTTAS
jgi:hypothetical protein